MTRDSELRYTRSEDRGHGRMGAVSPALLVAGCLLQVHPLQHCITAARLYDGKTGSRTDVCFIGHITHYMCDTVHMCTLHTIAGVSPGVGDTRMIN